MKIAVFYSGLFRTFLKVIENHKQMIFNLQECDVYISLWDIYGNNSHTFKECVWNSDDQIKESDKQLVLNALNPKVIEYQNFLEKKPQFDELKKLQDNISNANACINTISQYYKIERGYKLVKESGIKYDGILRIRTDNIFKIPLKLPMPEKDTLYTSLETRWNLQQNPDKTFTGVNEQFFWGNENCMDKCTSVYSNLRKIWTLHETQPQSGFVRIPCNPEYLFHNYIYKMCNLKVRDIITNSETESVRLHDLIRN